MTTRQQRAVELRTHGATYKKIGLELGVCVERARQIVLGAVKSGDKAHRFAWAAGLKNRYIGYLHRAGYASKEDVLLAILDGRIASARGHSTIRNLGKKGINEIRVWLGLPTTEMVVSEKSINRAIKLLQSSGYMVTKKDCKE